MALVAVRLEGKASAAMRPPAFHAIGSPTVRRRAAAQPVLRRYKLLEIGDGVRGWSHTRGIPYRTRDHLRSRTSDGEEGQYEKKYE